MTFSARTLVVALICSSFLGGCFNKSEKQEWEVEPDGQQSTFSVPQKVSNKVELEYLAAQVSLDDGAWQPLTISGGTASGRMNDILEGAHIITVQFVYRDPRYGELVLAEASKPVTITGGQRTRLEIADNDYNLSFDDDSDGITNADELDQDTDPTDAMDPPPSITSSVGDSSSAQSSSSLVSESSSSQESSDDSSSEISSSEVSSSEISSSSSEAGSSSSDGNIVGTPVLMASAGEDVSIQEGEEFQLVGQALNASASVSYSWRYLGMGQPVLAGANTPVLTFTAGNYLAEQVFTFELTVTQEGVSRSDTVDVTVAAVNEAPIVTFIPTERSVAPDAVIELLPFQHSDPESQPLTYSWQPSVLNPVTVDDFSFDNETATFTAPTLQSANESLTLVFELTVSDGVNATVQPITVVVQDDNDTPVARIAAANGATSVAENNTLVLSGATSTDKYTSTANLSYQWALESDVAFDVGITDWTTQDITVTAPNLAANQTVQFSLIVTDDSTPALSSTKTFFDVEITAVNDPAVLTLTQPGVALPGAAVTLISSVIDPDFEHQDLTYTYVWSEPAGYEGLLDSLSAATTTFTAPADLMAETTLAFSLQVTQVGAASLPVASDTVSAIISAGYVAPTAAAVLATPAVPTREAVAFDLTAAGSSAGSQAIASYNWTTDCTDGAIANENTAVATFTPANRLSDYTCNFLLTVADAATPIVGSSTDTLAVLITATDEAPTLVAPTPIVATAGAEVTLTASGTDPEDQALSFAWSTEEVGIALTNANTAQASFTAPNVATATNLIFTVTLDDGNADNLQTQDVVVQIGGNNIAPTAVITPVDNDLVADASTIVLYGSNSSDDFTDSADLGYQWQLLSTTPYDLNITDFTQSTLAFDTPNLAAAITLQFQLIVTDEQGEPSEATTYTVTVDAENAAPEVNVQPNPVSVAAESPVTLTAVVSNADEDQTSIDYTYAWTAPAGYENLIPANFAGAELTFTAPAILVDSQLLVFTVVATEAITNGPSSAVETVNVNVERGYVAPSASAALVGGGTVLTEGVAVNLTAAGSLAGTNPIASYGWETSCDGALTNANAEVASFTASNTLAPQTCDFTLTVSDGELNGERTDNLAVTINAGDDAPTAIAPAVAINANAGMPIALSGISVEDLDTAPASLSYRWTSNNSEALQLLSSTTELAPTFVPASAAEETFITFTLTVIDGGEAGRTAAQNAVSTANIDVIVAANNDTPKADIRLVMPASATEIAENTGVTLQAIPVAGNTEIDLFTAANDLTYTWTPNTALAALGVVSVSGQGQDQFNFAIDDLEAPVADLVVTLQVKDAQGAISTVVNYPFAIKAENAAPELTLNAPTSVNGGDTITFEAVARDPENLRTLSYRWQQLDESGNALAANDPAAVVCTEGNATNTCSFVAPTSNDDQAIRFEVTVAEAGSEDFLKESTANKTVSVTSGYIAPVLELALDAAVTEGDLATITASLTTTGTATISNYDWSGSTCLGQPVLEDFSAVTGETLTFITPAQQKSGYICDITLTATDSTNAVIVVPALAVNVSAEDDLPVAQIEDRVRSISGSSVDDPADELLDGSLSTDEENDTLYYRWSQDPADIVQVAWSSTGETDGRAFFSVPQQANETTLNFSLTVCDSENNPLRCDTTPESIVITVTASNQAPIAIISVNDAEVVGAGDGSGRITVQETNHPAQREVGEGEVEVTISAALSSDPAPTDGQLFYSWSLADNQGGGTTIELGSYANVTAWAEGELGLTADDWNAESFTFITPNFAEDRDLLFTLTVSDGELNVSKDLILTIAADNDSPVVTLLNPGVDNFPLSSIRSTRIGLTAEDPEGSLVSHEWRSADGYSDGIEFLSSTTETTPLFTAPSVLAETTFGFYPLVTDAQGAVAENVGVIEIPVASSDTQNPIASAVLEVTPLLDNAVGAEIRSTSTDDTGIASYLWSSTNSEITFTTDDQAVGIFDVSGMPAAGVATITLTVTDAAGKTDSVDVPVTIEASYTPWALALEVTSPPPADPAFDATEEQDEIVITAQVVTQGSNAITQYDWSDSTCSYTAPTGQPLTNPAVADFSVFSDSNTLTFPPITFVFTSYACVIKLTALDGEGAPVNAEISINIFADNDPAVAIAGALIGGVETEVESLTVKANDVISLISIEASDSDTQLRQGDIYWEIVEPEYAELFVFSSNLQRNTDLTIPLISGGAEVTVRLNVGRVFDDIQLVVEPQPISAEIKIAPEEIFDASFAFELEASVTGATANTNFEWVASKASWGPDHENITFENVQLSADGTTVTAKMRVSAEALNGIDRSSRDVDDNNVRTVTLDLQVDGNTVLTEPSEMRIVLPFVTVWDTTLISYLDSTFLDGSPSATLANELFIGTNPELSYDYLIDWGDGTSETINGNGVNIAAPDEGARHTYSVAGVQTVKIIGAFPHMVPGRDSGGFDSVKLMTVQRWGDIAWQDMQYFCASCSHLEQIDAMDDPDLSSVIDMSYMFYRAEQFNGDISNWDVSTVKNFSSMFSSAFAFNGDISSWVTSGAEDMSSMFIDADSFNQDISFNSDSGAWNTSNVVDMSGMFYGALSFDQDLSSWNIESVGLNSNGGMILMFENVILSTENYDAILIAWATQNVQPNNWFNAGDSQYTVAAASARAELERKGWTITDGGMVPVVEVRPHDPMEGGVSKGFVIAPLPNAPVITNYDWSQSTCPDGSDGTVAILGDVTNDTTGSVTITPPNFGTEVFTCNIVILLTVDGVDVEFTHELPVTPIPQLTILDAPGGSEIAMLEILQGANNRVLNIQADPAITNLTFSTTDSAIASLTASGELVMGGSSGEVFITVSGDVNGVALTPRELTVVVSPYTGNTPSVAKLAFNADATPVGFDAGWSAFENAPPSQGVYFSLEAVGDYLYVLEPTGSQTRKIQTVAFSGVEPTFVDAVDVTLNATGIFTNGNVLVVASTRSFEGGFVFDVFRPLVSGSLDRVGTFTVASPAVVNHSAFLGDAFVVPSQTAQSQLFIPDGATYSAQDLTFSAHHVYSSGNYLYVQALSGDVSRWKFDGAQLTFEAEYLTTARLVGARGDVAYLSDSDAQQLHALDFTDDAPSIARSLPLHNTSGLNDPTVNAVFYNDSLYLEANGRVTEFDVRVPTRPYLKSRYDLALPMEAATGQQADVFDIAAGAGRIYVGYGPTDGEHHFRTINIAELSVTPTADSADFVGGNRLYDINWNANGNTVSDVKCQVSAGKCEITDINLAASTARVVWGLPESGEHPNNHHEIIVAAGSENFLVANSNRVVLAAIAPANNGALDIAQTALSKYISDPSFEVVAVASQAQSAVTYRSDKPSVARVGLTSGLVELTGVGQASITAVGDDGAQASVTLNVSSYVGAIYDPYPLNEGDEWFGEGPASTGISAQSMRAPLNVIGVVGNGFTAYEYTANDFVSLNVADPSFPGELARHPLDSRVGTGTLRNSSLFFATSSENANSVSVWDVSNKNVPEPVKTLRFGSLGTGLLYADASDSYFAWRSSQFSINFVERSAVGENMLSAPYAITSSVDASGYDFYGFKIEGDMLFTGGIGFGEATAIRAYDISNPSQPRLVGQYRDSEALAEGFQADVFHVSNGYVFFRSILAGADAWEIVDFRDPSNPRLAFSSIGRGYAPASNRGGKVVENDILHLKSFIDLGGERTGVLQQFDISDPYAPILLGSYPKIATRGIDSTSGGMLYADGEIYDLSARLQIAEESAGASYGTTKTYFVRWDQPEQPEDNIFCRETGGGGCKVVSRDLSNNTATVEWTMPDSAFGDTVGEHEMYIFVGNENYFISNSARVDLVP